MLTLYQFEISPFCDKVRRALHWKQQPYQVREVPLTMTGFKKINPAKKVPALDDDGFIVCDSSEILQYLEERYPARPLLPKDAAGRAHCHVLEDWADESLYFYEMYLRFTIAANAKRWLPELVKRESAVMKPLARMAVPRVLRRTVAAQGLGRKSLPTILAEVKRHLEAIGALVGDDGWLVGGSLTAADLAVFAQLYCIQGAPEGAEIINGQPRVGRWMARVDAATQPPA